jgi:integrase/recombinase XerD
MTKQVSPLRQRMIDDMAMRNMSPATQGAYVRAVRNLSRFLRRSPDELTFDDVREYQLHLHLISRRCMTGSIFISSATLRR